MKAFRQFFDERNDRVDYPGYVGEHLHTVWQRLADTLADYADYVRDEMVRRADAEEELRHRR